MAFGDNLVSDRTVANYGTDYCLTRTVGNLLQIWEGTHPCSQQTPTLTRSLIHQVPFSSRVLLKNPIFTYCRRIK